MTCDLPQVLREEANICSTSFKKTQAPMDKSELSMDLSISAGSSSKRSIMSLFYSIFQGFSHVFLPCFLVSTRNKKQNTPPSFPPPFYAGEIKICGGARKQNVRQAKICARPRLDREFSGPDSNADGVQHELFFQHRRRRFISSLETQTPEEWGLLLCRER